MSLDRKTPPELNPSADILIPEVQTFNLSNGIPVHLLQGGTQEVVRIDFLFHAGSWFQKKSLQASATASAMRLGADGISSHKISETFDFYGAYLSAEPEKDQSALGLLCLSKDFQTLLPLFGKIIQKPDFPQEEVRIFLSNKRQEFLVNMQKVQTLARRHFVPLVLGAEHPYANIDNEEDYVNLKAEDLKSFHKEFFHYANCRIILAGRPPENWLQMLDETFGAKWGAMDTPPLVEPPIMIYPQPGIERIHKEGALQAALRIGKRIINKQHPDFPALSVANNLLGGFFGSRLMQNIRQDKGFTYGIGSLLVSFHHEGMFFVSTQVGTQVCKEATDEIFKELDRLCSEPAQDDELEILRNYLVGAMVRSLDGPFAQADKFRDLIGQGLDFNFTKRSIEEIRSFTAESILQTAQKYLDPASMSTIIAGDVK